MIFIPSEHLPSTKWQPLLSFSKIKVNRFLIKIIDVPCHGVNALGRQKGKYRYSI